jgi:hypothetical protein
VTFQAPDLHRLRERVRAYGAAKEAEALDILEFTVMEGVEVTRANLLAAHTMTGRAREEFAGGLPGRYVTGAMYDAIADDHEHPEVSGDTIWMAFGWFAGNMEPYFLDQEQGEGNIPAANALPPAEVTAISQVRGRLHAWQNTVPEV